MRGERSYRAVNRAQIYEADLVVKSRLICTPRVKHCVTAASEAISHALLRGPDMPAASDGVSPPS